MSKFKKGDRVWVYDCPCEPRVATVIDKIDGLSAYQIEFKYGRERLRVFTENHLYKYPEDLHLMLCHIKDDVHHLDRIALHVEEFSYNLDYPNNPIGWGL